MIKEIFQSKFNPGELSLTVEAGAKTIISIIVAIAAVKGVDVSPLIDGIKALADQVVVMVASAVATYHAVQAIWGFVRRYTITKPVETTSTSVVG